MTQGTDLSFFKNVIKLIGGSLGAHLISLMLLPVITRLFLPDAFGELGIFAAVTGVLGVTICFRYEMAIVLPKRNIEAVNVWWLCILITSVYTGLICLIIFLFNDQFLQFFYDSAAVKYIWFIPVVLFIHGIYLASNYWNTRDKNFGIVSLSKIGNQTGNSTSATGMGFLGHITGKDLILASIIGRAVAATIQLSGLYKFSKLAVDNFRLKYIFHALKRYKKFPLFGIWSILLNSAAWQLPVILLGIFFPVATVGFYALGLRILQVPMNLLGSSIGQVFFQLANTFAINEQDKNKVAEITLEIMELLVLFSMVPLALLACAGEEIFAFTFGQEWREAGYYAKVIMPWIFLWYLSAPFSTVFAIYERQGLQLVWNIFNFSLRLLAIIGGGLYSDNPLIALALIAVSGVGIYSVKFWLTFNLIQLSFSDLFKRLYCYIIWTVLLSGTYFSIIPYLILDWQRIILVVLLTSVYSVWLLHSKSYLIKKIYYKSKGG